MTIEPPPHPVNRGEAVIGRPPNHGLQRHFGTVTGDLRHGCQGAARVANAHAVGAATGAWSGLVLARTSSPGRDDADHHRADLGTSLQTLTRTQTTFDTVRFADVRNGGKNDASKKI